MTPSSVLTFWFDTTGRVSRKGLALGVLLPLIAALALVDLSNSWVLTTAFWTAFAWPLLIATPWKRLHDMDRSGRWTLIFVVFYVIGFFFFLAEYAGAEGGWHKLFDGAPPETTDKDLTANGLGGFSTVLIFLPIQLFWLYLVPGTKGDNRYGPPPQPGKTVQ